MASELLYLVFLFTITLPCIYSQENTPEPDLVLIPGPHRVIILDQRAPLLLNCSVNITGSNQLNNYVWFRDGKVIEVNRRRKPRVRETNRNKFKDLNRINQQVSILPNGSLYLPNGASSLHGIRNTTKNRKLDGIYECIVNTTKGVALARRVRVSSASISQNFQVQPTAREAYIGGVTRFECKISAEPSATYIWHKDNKEAHDPRFTILPSGVLQISDVQPNDEGTYWCQAAAQPFTVQENAVYTWKQSKKADLKVKSGSSHRVDVLAVPQNIEVAIGETAFFECLADGDPMPEITWIRKDTQEDFSKDIYGPGNLRLLDVKAGDAGSYECTISPVQGAPIKYSATLLVLVPPEIEKKPVSYSVPVSKTQVTNCRAVGFPAPEISWFHNGTNIEENPFLFPRDSTRMDLSQLKLYSQQPYHSGYYVCLAENSVGQDMALILAKVSLGANAADQPRNVKVFAINSSAINVTWDQPVPASTYVLNHNAAEATTPPQQTICPAIKGRHHQFCEIGGLTPFTNYSVAITAFIKTGASLRTNPEYVRTLEDVPIAVPAVSLYSPKHYSILVSWTPLTLSQSRGIVTSYKVYHRLAGHIGEFSRDVSADQTSFLIDNLEPGETYEVLVLATTKAGFPNIDHQKWTSLTLPPSNETSPPMLTVNFVNLSSVLLEWQDPKQEPILGYILELQSHKSLIDQVTLPASTHLYSLNGLDSKKQYRVKLVAETSVGLSAPATLEFVVEKLADKLVPKNLNAVNITANSVALEWSKLAGINVVYEICFSFEQDKSSESCLQSNENSVVISKLTPYKRYEFKVRPLIGDVSDFDHLIVQTKEERSSPPVNVTVEAVKAGTVFLTWLSPTEPHGDITSYVILYGKETSNPTDFTWKTITQESTSVIQNAYSTQIEDLEPGIYFFKLAAVNGAGQGMSSENQSVEIKCYDTISFCQTQPTLVVPPEQNIPVPNGGSITFIVGIIVGILILAILIFVIVYCWRNRSTSRALDPNLNHSPICRGNGHITSPSNPSGHKPGNGHVHLTIGNSGGDYCHETINLPESTPMLQKLPENEQSDSKGPPDLIIPNGLRSNGITKANYKAPGQPIILHTGDLNISNNSEELQLLMAAMLMTSDGNDALANSVEMTPISTLDDIDRGDDESCDHSSEDSGTGCRRAGMPCSELNISGSSPASSPGGSSLHRHRYWEKGRQGDEFGGVFIDSSTGAAIKLIGAGAVEGQTVSDGFDDGTANDRDSGHGSEAKSHIGILNSGADSVIYSAALISDMPVSASSLELPVTKQSKDDSHQQPSAELAIPFQPDPPQLPSVSSRNLNNHTRPQHNHRQHRGVRPHISHSDLPPPPPPPHHSSPALGLQAAVTATTTAAAVTTAAPAELNSSGSIDEGGQNLSNGLGSILNRQLEGKTEVAFCPPRPPPSPPHIA